MRIALELKTFQLKTLTERMLSALTTVVRHSMIHSCASQELFVPVEMSHTTHEHLPSLRNTETSFQLTMVL